MRRDLFTGCEFGQHDSWRVCRAVLGESKLGEADALLISVPCNLFSEDVLMSHSGHAPFSRGLLGVEFGYNEGAAVQIVKTI